MLFGRRLFLLAFVIMMTLYVSLAQGLCPYTLDTPHPFNTQCDLIETGQMCLGYGSVAAIDNNGNQINDFTMPGDIFDFASLDNLILTSAEEAVGIVVFEISVDDTESADSMTLVMYGDGQIQRLSDDDLAFIMGMSLTDGCEPSTSGLLMIAPENANGNIRLNDIDIKLEAGTTSYFSGSSLSDYFHANLYGERSVVRAGENAIVLEPGQFTSIARNQDFELESRFRVDEEARDLQGLLPVWFPNMIDNSLFPVLDPANTSHFTDAALDVYACDTEQADVDPEVDITDVTMTAIGEDTMVIHLALADKLTNDFSFGQRLFVLDANGDPTDIMQWATHDGNSFTGVVDPEQNAFVDDPDNTGVMINHHLEMGIITFEFPITRLPDSLGGIYIEGSHTPDSQTQPQPTQCDDAFFEISLND